MTKPRLDHSLEFFDGKLFAIGGFGSTLRGKGLL